MVISSITNGNQYAAMAGKQADKQKEGPTSQGTDPLAQPAKTDSFEQGPYEPSEMDLATRKALAKGPLDEAELERRRLDREYMRNVSIADVRQSMQSSQPQAESVARNHEKAARFGPIRDKVISGMRLTEDEKNYLRENYPEVYRIALQKEHQAKSRQ